ncbi:MAG: DUF547 domain-containing protein, partial [Bacteroidota bacterium]
MNKQVLYFLTFTFCLACKPSPTNEQEKPPTETSTPVSLDSLAHPVDTITPAPKVSEDTDVTETDPEENTTPKQKELQPDPIKKEDPKPQQIEEQQTSSSPDSPTDPPAKEALVSIPTAEKEDKTPPTTTTEPANNASLPNGEEAENEEAPQPKPFSHDQLDALLRKHVSSNGKVNYASFKKEQTALDSYLQLLSQNAPQGQSRNEQIAYWINAYNAFTIDLILDNYPTNSIMNLDGGNPWEVKRILIGGKRYSLNEIEKTILLQVLKEPRVHFAVNCAAKSCPPLRNRAWKANTLNRDLETATKSFINNSTFNQIEKKKAQLSKIFEWYASDFGDVIGGEEVALAEVVLDVGVVDPAVEGDAVGEVVFGDLGFELGALRAVAEDVEVQVVGLDEGSGGIEEEVGP